MRLEAMHGKPRDRNVMVLPVHLSPSPTILDKTAALRPAANPGTGTGTSAVWIIVRIYKIDERLYFHHVIRHMDHCNETAPI
jgi:hypothetical protein